MRRPRLTGGARRREADDDRLAGLAETERFADATTASAARLAAREAPAAGTRDLRFNAIDYSAVGAVKGRIIAAPPCKVGE